MIKALGGLLAVASLLLAVTLLSACTAAAAELCKAAEEPCAEANVYAAGTLLTGKSTKAEIVTSSGTVTCKETSLQVETAAEAGVPLPASLTQWSWSSCLLGEKTACTLTVLRLAYYATLAKTEKDKGTMTISNGGEGTPSVAVKCSATISCTFNAASMTLAFEGGKTASIKGTKVGLKKEGGVLCPAEASWTAAYNVAPESLHIEEATTKLCTEPPDGEGKCPFGDGFTGSLEASLVAGKSAEFISTGGPTGTVSCDEAPLKGDNFVEAGTGKITLMKFESAGACTSTLAGEPVVKTTVPGVPFAQSSFSYRSPSRAILTAAGGPPLLVLVVESAPVAETCDYRATRTSWVAFAYNPMKIKAEWNFARTGGSNMVCPALIKEKGEWTVTKVGGGDIWVTQ